MKGNSSQLPRVLSQSQAVKLIFFSLSRLYMILAMPSFVLLSNMQNIPFLLPLERKRSSTRLSVDTLLLPEWGNAIP